MRRWRLAAAGLVVASVALVPPPPAGAAAECNLQPAQSLTSAEAAVSRPALRSPSEYGLSNVYARTELATRPDFVYAEAGPQYAGAFEALLPVGTPPPPRAVSAYPSEDIPDADAEDWGGHSETKVTGSSAFASSTGSTDLGVPGLHAETARSFTSTVVVCNVITIVAGWSAANVTFGDGPRFEQIGQQVTLVVGPRGSSSKVETTTVPAGRPFAPFTDPMEQGGGPKLEIGDPTTATAPGTATATGGGFYFLQTDPATGQGAGYRIGSVEASIRVVVPGAVKAAGAPKSEALPPLPPPTQSSVSTTGDAPAPAAAAVAPLRTALVSDTVTDLLEVTSPNVAMLGLFASFLAVVTASVTTVVLGRRRSLTLDWIARRAVAGATRFGTMYLRW
jgi:hypothetical protein